MNTEASFQNPENQLPKYLENQFPKYLENKLPKNPEKPKEHKKTASKILENQFPKYPKGMRSVLGRWRG